MTILDATTEFMRLAELPEGIGIVDSDTRLLRLRLLVEEIQEYLSGEAAVVDFGDDEIWLCDGDDTRWG